MSASIQSILAGLALWFATTPATATEPLRANEFVVFWAAWCAPCRAELAAVDVLSSAAVPRTLIFVAVESAGRSRILFDRLPRAQVRIADEPLPALYRRLGISGPVALPLSAMTDGKGRICAAIRGGATVAAIAAAKRTCALAP